MMHTSQFHLRKQAMTLIEIILYIAISSIVLTILLNFSWKIIDHKTRTNVSLEVIDNGRFVMEILSRDIRSADSVNIASSVLDTHPGVLVLQSDGNEIIFDTYVKNISIGGINTNIRKLRKRINLGNDEDLTSDQVSVNNFIIQNKTRGPGSQNINFEISLEYANPANDHLRQKSISLKSSATIRQR